MFKLYHDTLETKGFTNKQRSLSNKINLLKHDIHTSILRAQQGALFWPVDDLKLCINLFICDQFRRKTRF